jgi:hypothetical protein
MPRKLLGISPDIKQTEVRYRLREPSLFKKDSFVTVNIGEYHRLIRGIPKNSIRYRTQSVRVDKEMSDNKEEEEVTKNLILQAKKEK